MKEVKSFLGTGRATKVTQVPTKTVKGRKPVLEAQVQTQKVQVEESKRERRQRPKIVTQEYHQQPKNGKPDQLVDHYSAKKKLMKMLQQRQKYN